MKRKIFIQLVVLAALGLGALLSLVTFDALRLREPTDYLQFSVIQRQSDATLTATMRRGMQQAASDFDIELRFVPPTIDNSDTVQAELLAHELEREPDGILLFPADCTYIGQAVTAAASEVAILTLETPLADAGGVCADNVAIGEMLAQAVCNGVEVGESVILLDSMSGQDGAISERLHVVKACLEAEGRLVQINTLPTTDIVPVIEAMIKLRRPPAIVCMEASALQYSVQAVVNQNSKTLLYGVGSTPMITSYVEQGKITSIVVQNEFATGYLAVQALLEQVQTGIIQQVNIPVTTIRQEHIYLPENQKLLFPIT